MENEQGHVLLKYLAPSHPCDLFNSILLLRKWHLAVQKDPIHSNSSARMRRSVLPFVVTATLAAVHTVEVGENGLNFSPQTITAVPGDMVVFELYTNHNVVQGSFSSPCQTSDSSCRSPGSCFIGSAAKDAFSLQRPVL